MFEHYIAFLINFISEWGYLAIVVGMALESACFPVPSEVVLPFAGYLVAEGRLTFGEALSAGLLGGMIGSAAAYTAGRIGGRPLVLKYGRCLLITEQKLRQADRWVEKYGDYAAFWARFLPIVRTFISLPLGIARMSWGRFLLFSFAGSIPWTAVLIYGGQKLRENWTEIMVYGDRINLAILALLIGLLLVVMAKSYLKRWG